VFIRVRGIRTVWPPSRLNRLIFDGPGPSPEVLGRFRLRSVTCQRSRSARRRALPCLVLRLLILTASQTTSRSNAVASCGPGHHPAPGTSDACITTAGPVRPSRPAQASTRDQHPSSYTSGSQPAGIGQSSGSR
jgi:hypothetical protein